MHAAARTARVAYLLDRLERDGAIELAWVIANAPDGDLTGLWTTCGDAATILTLAARVTDRRTLVGAACACARTVLDCLPPHEQRPVRVLDVVEAWCRGEATAEAVRCAADEAVGATTEARGNASVWAAIAAIHAANAVDEPSAAADASATASMAGGGGARLASLVRELVPCPSLDRLCAAYARV